MDGRIVGVETVTKRFGGLVAVNDVSFDVARGEFVSLLGPSGCGKSTMLRMIAGFEKPDEGRIVIDDVDVADVPAHQRPANMVFQSYALFPHLTTFENVAFGLRRKKVPKADITVKVEQFLRLVSLDGLGERYPSQLSGGQQQRVALARALVNQPKVLLLDEPLGALDLKLRKRMQVELKQLQRNLGISFIYVTHDQEEALALSDRIAVMSNGRILQLGSGRQIYDRPRSQFVANFLGEANILSGTLVEAAPVSVVAVADRRLRVHTPEPAERKIDGPVLLAIRPEHIQIGRSPPAGANSLPCTVTDKVFLGNAFVVYARDAAGGVLAARAVERDLFDRLDAGQQVYAFWPDGVGSLVSE